MSEEEMEDGRSSNLRGEMNGKGSRRETGDKTQMRRWCKKRCDTEEYERNGESDNEPYAQTLSALFSRSSPFGTKVGSSFLYSHMFSTLFPLFFSHPMHPHLHKKYPEAVRPVVIAQKHKSEHANVHGSAHTEERMSQTVLIAVAAASPFISL